MKSRLPTILVTALVTALVTSAMWAVGLVVVYRYFYDEPPPFVVRIDAPAEVAPGEVVALKVEISNPTLGNLELGSIDVYDSLMEGFTFVASDPAPTEKNHTLDFSTFYFSRTLPPGKSFTATFRMKATKAGVWTGDVDCCTPEERFVTTSVTIRVRGDGEGKGDSGEEDAKGGGAKPEGGAKSPRKRQTVPEASLVGGGWLRPQ